MARVLTGFAWVGFLVWTLLCLGGWGAIALGGDLLRWVAGTALAPATGGPVTSVLNFIEAFGTIVLTWIWIAGSVLILVVGAFFKRAVANASIIRFEQAAPDGMPDPSRMKDVTPPSAPEPDFDQKRLPPR